MTQTGFDSVFVELVAHTRTALERSHGVPQSPIVPVTDTELDAAGRHRAALFPPELRALYKAAGAGRFAFFNMAPPRDLGYPDKYLFEGLQYESGRVRARLSAEVEVKQLPASPTGRTAAVAALLAAGLFGCAGASDDATTVGEAVPEGVEHGEVDQTGQVGSESLEPEPPRFITVEPGTIEQDPAVVREVRRHFGLPTSDDALRAAEIASRDRPELTDTLGIALTEEEHAQVQRRLAQDRHLPDARSEASPSK